MKTLFYTLVIVPLLFLLALPTPAQPHSSPWDDEPNELSWEHFANCRFCFKGFADWWKTLPAGRQNAVWEEAQKQGVLQAPPQSQASLWIQGEAFKGPSWSVNTIGGRTVLKGPPGHNRAVAKVVVEVPAEGHYRLWSHWWNSPGYHNSFQLNIRPIAAKDFEFDWQTLAQADYLDHRFAFAWHRRPTPAPVAYQVDKSGFQWESTPLFHLPKGQVVIEMTPTIHAGPYTHRNVDCFLLTRDPFLFPGETDIPDSKLDDPVSLIVHQSAASAGSRDDWKLWSIRPAAMPLSQAPKTIARLWGDWRDQLIDRLAKGEAKTPHEKVLEHGFYFDNRFNLIGTPAQVAQEIVRQKTFPGFFKWVEAETFDITRGWAATADVKAGEGKTLQASYQNGAAEASSNVNVPQTGNYRLWIRAAEIAKYYNYFDVEVHQQDKVIQKMEFRDMGSTPGYTYAWRALDVALQAGPCKIVVTKNSGKAPYAYRKIDCMTLTDNLDWKPEQLQRPVPVEVPAHLTPLARAGQRGEAAAWFAGADEQWTGFSMTNWPQNANQFVGLLPVQIKVQPGAVQSRVLHLTNPSDRPITFSPYVATGGSLLRWRLVAYQFQPAYGWQPMPLLNRREVTIPPHLTASLWLSFDARDLAPGIQTAVLDIGSQQIRFDIDVSGVDIRHAKAPLVGGWCKPWPMLDGWQTFADIGLNIVHGKALSKVQMKKYQISLFTVGLGVPASAGEVNKVVDAMKAKGLDYADWSWIIMDEPSKETYQQWIEAAKIIRQADPKIRIWCNPGWIGASPAESVTAMAPWIDNFCPYIDHFAVKDPVYQTLLSNTGSMKLLYTTPCFLEKTPGAPMELLGMAELSLKHHRDGWNTFSLCQYYPYAASAWDETNAIYPDQAVSIYPGARNQVIGSRNLEAVRQAIQNWKTARITHDKSE